MNCRLLVIFHILTSKDQLSVLITMRLNRRLLVLLQFLTSKDYISVLATLSGTVSAGRCGGHVTKHFTRKVVGCLRQQ